MRVERLFAPFRFTRSKGALSVYDLNIKDVVTDPAAANANTVYVCVPTPLGDGHSGAAAAYANGCRCFLAARGLGLREDAAVYTAEEPEAHLGALAARCFGYPARSLTVFGITGTHGKTSVADTLAGLLRRAGKRFALLTTDGTEINGVFEPAPPTAVNAADVQRMLRAARRKRAEFAIVEFSAYMLAHHAEKSIPFAAVLLTDLAPRHIGKRMHGDFASYWAAKKKLLECPSPLVFLPEPIEDLDTKGRVLCYGDTGDIVAQNTELLHDGEQQLGTSFSLTYKRKTEEIFYPVIGDFATRNATAAAALALAAGLSLAEIARGLSGTAPIGRMECIYASNGVLVFLDTAYEAEDLLQVLHSLRRVTSGKLSVVLGSVGERAVFRRAPLGRAAVENADFVYFTADDPGSEPVTGITKDMVSEIEDASRYLCIPSRRKAILRAMEDLRTGDTLLILGKARDETQLVNGIKEAFSDRDVVFVAARRM